FCPGAGRRLLPILATLAVPTLMLFPVLLLRAQADHEAAYEERMNLTRVAWNMFKAHPVLGIGFGTYPDHLHEYLPEDWTWWLTNVHDRYLRIPAESGIIGFSRLFLLFGVILKKAYLGIRQTAMEYRPLQISLVAALVAIYWEQYWDVFASRQQAYLS